MIVLDTNVVSEFIKPRPDPRVLVWVDSRLDSDVATTAITLGELGYGAARMPTGQRKRQLEAEIAGIADDFRGRIEPFDASAADYYGSITAERERLGRPINIPDAQIASICRRLSATLATRNTKDFEHTGIDLIDPWQAS